MKKKYSFSSFGNFEPLRDSKILFSCNLNIKLADNKKAKRHSFS